MRRTPLCAFCGAPLRERPHKLEQTAIVRIPYDSLPGRPEVGWHGHSRPFATGCYEADAQADVLTSCRDAELDDSDNTMLRIENALARIASRGPGRLIRNRARTRRRLPALDPESCEKQRP